MAVRVKITTDVRLVGLGPVRAGQVVTVDARTARQLVADGAAVYVAAHDAEGA